MASLGGRPGLRVAGTVHVPGDKSVSHRALMLGALATGRSRVRGILQSADIQSTASALRALGWSIPELANEMVVEGAGLRAPTSSSATLNCGNSGTTARLVAGIAAAQPLRSTFVGDNSLSRRPMKRVSVPLEAMGAQIEFPSGRDGLPMVISGGDLKSVEWDLQTPSAQVKSAILLAGLCAQVPVAVREPVPTRSHTESMLRAAGIEVVVTDDGWIRLAPVEALSAVDVDVPGDPSSAAFFLALGALADSGSIEVSNVLHVRERSGFAETLNEMGASIRRNPVHGAASGDQQDLLVTTGHPLRGVTVPLERVPAMIDEIPLLACVGARAEGVTTVRGATELRVKESDRIAAMIRNLRALGVECEEYPDGFSVTGSARPLRGAVQTFDDHRIAMSFGVLGALPGNEIIVDQPECVGISYPQFWSDLRRVIV